MADKEPKLVTVYPREGHFTNGVPPVATTTDPATAQALVETGAFTAEPPKERKP